MLKNASRLLLADASGYFLLGLPGPLQCSFGLERSGLDFIPCAIVVRDAIARVPERESLANSIRQHIELFARARQGVCRGAVAGGGVIFRFVVPDALLDGFENRVGHGKLPVTSGADNR